MFFPKVLFSLGFVATLSFAAMNASVKKNILQQCSQTTANTNACTCAVEKLSQKYNEQIFFQWQMQTLSETEEQKLSENIFFIATECFVKDECTNELEPILGASAKSTCSCTAKRLQKLKKKPDLSSFLLNPNFYEESRALFEQIMFQEMIPCLPKKMTKEIRQNLIQDCADESGNAEGVQKICTCVIDTIFHSYDLKTFIQESFTENPHLEMNINEALTKCME